MKLRRWKVAALLATSGIMLQLGSCIAQLVFQQVYVRLLSGALDAIIGNDNGTTDTP